MEAVFRPENIRFFFRWIPANFLCFPAGTQVKSSHTSFKNAPSQVKNDLTCPSLFPILQRIIDLGVPCINTIE
jgi:hypothetical protein